MAISNQALVTDSKWPVIVKGYKSFEHTISDDIKAVTVVMSGRDLVRIMKFIDRDNRARDRSYSQYHDKHPDGGSVGRYSEPIKIIIINAVKDQ